MKILIFSSKYPPEVGGVEEVVKNLSIQFSKKAEVLVLTTYNFKSTSTNFFSKFIKGFKVSGVGESKNNIVTQRIFMSLPRTVFGYLSFWYRFPASIFAIRKTIKTYNPDIINAHFLDDSLYYFYFSTIFLKAPIILDIHGNEIHLFSKLFIYKFFFNKILDKSNNIIVHTKYMKSQLLKEYNLSEKRVFIVPNGVDTNKFNPSKGYKKPKYFLYVGRFDTKKGIEVLLKAYTKVQDKITTKLIIVGDGKGEKKHGSLTANYLKQKYGSKNITFTGMIESTLVNQYYKGAYFTVFPSLYEPFGIVAIESISCGVPFVASSGGFEEISKNTKAGITFTPGSIDELASILLKIDKQPKIRDLLHKQALKNKESYSWNNVSKEYFNIINI